MDLTTWASLVAVCRDGGYFRTKLSGYSSQCLSSSGRLHGVLRHHAGLGIGFWLF